MTTTLAPADAGTPHPATEPATQSAPAASAQTRRPWGSRIVGLDLARLLALLGMIAAHTLDLRDDAGNPTALHHLVSGRPAALFAVLAGVSLALMSGGRAGLVGVPLRIARTRIATRGLIVLVLGLALGTWVETAVGVILATYGLLFVAATPLLGLRARTLGVLTAGWVLAAPFASHALRLGLAERPLVGIGLPAGEIASMNPQGLDLLHPIVLLRDLLLYSSYPMITWFGYLLAGLTVGRLALKSARTAAALLGVGALLTGLGLAVQEALLRVPHVLDRLGATADQSGEGLDGIRLALRSMSGATPVRSWWWELMAGSHSGSVMDLVTTIGSALLVLGAALLLTRHATRFWWYASGAGATTLTLYCAHVISADDRWYPPGLLGLPTWLFWVTVPLALAFGTGCRVLARSGPLEALTSSLARRAGRLADSDR